MMAIDYIRDVQPLEQAGKSDAEDPKSHTKVLRACAEYCNELADVMDGDQ